MFQRPDFGNVAVKQTVNAANISADTNGTAVDTRGYAGVMVVANVGQGASLTNDNHYTLIVQHSDASASGWENVAAGDLHGHDGAVIATIDAAADDDVLVTAPYLGRKRYVRVRVDEHGSGASLHVAAEVVLTRAKYPTG